MFSILKKLLFTSILAGLLLSNVLTLTSAAFNTALSGALATAFGVRTVTASLSSRLQASESALARSRATVASRKAATRRFGQSLVARSRRVAARSVAAIPVESLPYLGAAAIVAGTAYELYAMCETLADLDALYDDLGIDEEVSDDTFSRVCRATASSGDSPGDTP